MNHQCDDKFYQLLRLSLRLTRELPVETDAETWQQLYHTAVRQSLVGVCYQGVCLMPEGNRPPVETALQWATQAETIRGMNGLLYQEAAQLTQQFAEKGRRTAILKGQANARLYPDPYSRQPGDIDIWVEGGKESVLALLPDHPTATYHHVHLPTDEKGVVVEIHFRPASGNHNPLTNRRLQRWLEQEILTAEMVEEGFCVPSVRFALVMQLAHIQRHFLSGGIGLRHICDYFLLLQQASPEDRQTIAPLLKPFGLDEFRRAAEKVRRIHELRNPPAATPQEQDNGKSLTPHSLSLFLKTEHRVVRVSVADIRYIEGMSEYVKIFLEGQKPVTVLLAMKKLEEQLPPYFMRIHRSYIVNLNKILEVNKNRVVVAPPLPSATGTATTGDPAYLPIGDLYRERFNEWVASRMLGK